MNEPVRVLVFTPTPTHPPIQGNRQRVYDICRSMQSMGADITLFYYATEGLGPAEARKMRETWGQLEVVFPRGFVPQRTFVRYPAIDDWYDESITDAALRLCARKRFDVCVVNYVWYSKLFESLPASTIRVIDTHDVFGGRAERFAELDIAPQWFHTSVAQETIGLDRSDFVLAIQESEARILRERTQSDVRTIGFLSAPDPLPQTLPTASRRMSVGYVGSANPFNVSSILAFGHALQATPSAASSYDVHLAGPICGALPASQSVFVTHGVVDSVPDFLRSIDVVVNPMLGGTGLKIKSLEALSFGKPLVATIDAMVGIETQHDGHQMRDVEDVMERLHELSGNPARLKEEVEISRQVFESYRRAQLEAFSLFWSELEREVGARRALPATPRTTGVL